MLLDENGQPVADNLGGLSDGPAVGAPGNFTEAAPLNGGGLKPLSPFEELKERGRLNYRHSDQDSSIGALGTAKDKADAKAPTFTDKEIPGVSDFRNGNPFAFSDGELNLVTPERKQEAQKSLEDLEADMLAYKAMRPYQGFLEGAAAFGGWLGGAAKAPENILFPEMKPVTALLPSVWRAKNPLLNDMISYGLGQGAVQGIVDPVKQAAELSSGLKKEYDPTQTMVAVPLGIAFGGGVTAVNKGASILYRSAMDTWAARLTGEPPKLNAEMRPHEPPAPENAPAAPATPAPDRLTARPEPPVAEGHVRLYRADAPGVAPKTPESRVEFTTDQTRALETASFGARNEERTAISYIDVPESVAIGARTGDTVSIPGSEAAARATLPEPPKASPGSSSETSVTVNGQTTTTRTSTVAAEAVSPKITTEPVYTQDGSGFRAVVDGRTVLNERGAAITYKTEAAARSAAEKSIIKSAPVKASDEQLKTLSSKDLQDIAIKQGTKVDDVFTPDGQKSLPKDKLIEIIRAKQPKAAEPVKPAAEVKAPEVEPIDLPDGASKNWRAVMEDVTKSPDDLAAATQKEIARIEKQIDAAANKGQDGKAAELIALRDSVEEAGEAAQRSLMGRTREMAQQAGIAQHGRAPGPVASNLAPENLPPVERFANAIRRIADELDLILKQGNVGRGNVASIDLRKGLVRLRNGTPDSFTDFAHELGHHTEATLGAQGRAFVAANENELRAIGGNAVANLRGLDGAQEGFGEFMAGFITNRGILQARNPQLYARFRTLMEQQNPELLRVLDDAENVWRTYNDVPTRAQNVTVSVTELSGPLENNPLKLNPVAQWWNNAYRMVVNEQHPLQQAMRFLAIEFEKKHGRKMDLRPDEDFVKLAQMFRDGGGNMAGDDLAYGVQRVHDLVAEGPSFFSIMRRVTHDPGTTTVTADGAVAKARIKAFDDYLVAKWHLDLLDQMRNGQSNLTRPPTRLADGQARLIVQEAERYNPDIVGLSEEVYAFQKNLTQKEFDYGLITAEELAERMAPHNHRYVPLRRDMSDITGVMASGNSPVGLENLGNYGRRGSDRDVLSVMDSIMLKTYSINNQGTENWISNALRATLRHVGGKEAAAIGNEIPNHVLRGRDVRMEEILTAYARQNGWTPADTRDFVRDTVRMVGADTRARMYRAEAIEKGHRPIVFGWEGGERYAIELPDGDFGRQIMEALDSVGPKGAPMWAQSTGIVMDLLFATSGTLRTGATSTPTYMVKNAIRDAFMQFSLVPESGLQGLFTNHASGGRSFIAGDDAFRMYSSLGGIRGGIAANTMDRTHKLEVLRQRAGLPARDMQRAEREIAAAMEQVGVPKTHAIRMDSVQRVVEMMEISETAGRVGLFKTIYDANIALGRDHRYAMFDAAHKARDFLDFGRHGSKMEIIARLVPFLNSNIQGVDKFYRTAGETLWKTPTTLQEKEFQDAARRSLIPRATALAAISAAIAYNYSDDPVYNAIPTQLRSQYWIFRAPFLKSGTYGLMNGEQMNLPEGMLGGWVFIPKPWEPATIFNLAERAAEFTLSRDPAAAAQFMKSLRYTSYMPNPLDFPLLKTSMGLASNYNSFFDRPIIPERLQKLSPHMQSTEYTNKFYIAVAQGLNGVWKSDDAHKFLKENIPMVGAVLAAAWSPLEAQYMVQGLLGDWPRELGGVVGIGNSLATGKPVKTADIPVMRAFIRDKLGGGEPLREVYNQVGINDGRLTRAANSFKRLVETGDDAAAQQLFGAMDDSQKAYVRLQIADAGPLAKALHPLERSKNMMTVGRSIKDGLLQDGGLATFTDRNQRIKIEPKLRDIVVNMIDEMTAIEARNSLIVQGVPGYKTRAIIDTKPYLTMIEKASPEIARELSVRFADKKVFPIATVQEMWPEAQKALRIGGGKELGVRLKTIGMTAGTRGYLAGGVKSGRGAVDSGGVRIRRGKQEYPDLPGGGTP